eukprot:6205269-Pleurochrysis_carterae.AAC.2
MSYTFRANRFLGTPCTSMHPNGHTAYEDKCERVVMTKGRAGGHSRFDTIMTTPKRVDLMQTTPKRVVVT